MKETKTSPKTRKKLNPISPLVNEGKRASKNKLFWIGVAVLILLFLYYFKSLFIAAIVNGQPISRVTLIQDLEKKAGKRSLDDLISKTLILQEARKQNIQVSSSEINDEIKKIEDNLQSQGLDLNSALAQQNMTKADLIEQIRITKMIEKMISGQITVTDQEVDEYLIKNKDFLPKDAKPEELKDSVKKQLRQQKMDSRVQTWLDELKNKAQISYFINY